MVCVMCMVGDGGYKRGFGMRNMRLGLTLQPLIKCDRYYICFKFFILKELGFYCTSTFALS